MISYVYLLSVSILIMIAISAEMTNKLMDSDIADPVNLGDSNPRTLTEVAEKIIKTVNSKSKISYSSAYDFSIKPAIPNIDKAKDGLDWIPLISLDDGLEETVDYYKNTVIIRKKRLEQVEETEEVKE